MASIACVRVSKHRAAGRSNAITARMRHKRSVTIPKWLPNIGAGRFSINVDPGLGQKKKKIGQENLPQLLMPCAPIVFQRARYFRLKNSKKEHAYVSGGA